MKIGRYQVELTHPDKVLFPKSKITKEQLASYYLSVAPNILSHVQDRPISMVRYPQGIKEKGFFQKHVPADLPKWISTGSAERKEGESFHMLLCNQAATLVWLVNYDCITPHVWLSRIDKPHLPDRMIFDLDPPTEKHFHLVVKGALALREILEGKYRLKAFVSTTGSRGLHVLVPIRRKNPFDRVRTFAKKIAEELAAQNPRFFTTAIRKSARQQCVYIDVMRNSYAQTVVAPYSVRAKERAPIAMPLFWEELENHSLRSDSFNLCNYQERMGSPQPWEHLPLCNLTF